MIEEEYWYWLTNIKNIGNKKISILLKKFENPAEVYFAGEKKLENIFGIKKEDICNILTSKDEYKIKKEVEFLKEKNIKFIYYGSLDYPEKLFNIYDPPYSFYIKGSLPKPEIETIAIIGARNCTEYGKIVAKEIAFKLSGMGVQIISGMARGVDSSAQWGAINNNGKCFAVLGSGIDVCYPKENKDLYLETMNSGGVISEYSLGSKPDSWRFPHRNRIISGLADKLIVVEAKEKSGTCITVEYALEQGKDVYAVPGRVNDPLSQGCNRLIKQGANILTDIKDVLYEYGDIVEEGPDFSVNRKYPIAKDLEVLYSCVYLLPKSLHDIIEESGMETKDVINGLMRLEFMDLIHEPIKNYYSLKE